MKWSKMKFRGVLVLCLGSRSHPVTIKDQSKDATEQHVHKRWVLVSVSFHYLECLCRKAYVDFLGRECPEQGKSGRF